MSEDADELVDKIASDLLAGTHRLEVVNDLVQRGIPLQTARELVAAIESRIKPVRQTRFMRVFVIGTFGLILGTGITFLVAPLTKTPGIIHPVYLAYAWCGASLMTMLVGLGGWLLEWWSYG